MFQDDQYIDTFEEVAILVPDSVSINPCLPASSKEVRPDYDA
jgi:hypothetical protein